MSTPQLYVDHIVSRVIADLTFLANDPSNRFSPRDLDFILSKLPSTSSSSPSPADVNTAEVATVAAPSVEPVSHESNGTNTNQQTVIVKRNVPPAPPPAAVAVVPVSAAVVVPVLPERAVPVVEAPVQRKAIAIWDYPCTQPDDLGFVKGDVIVVEEEMNADWWRGTCHGRSGLFPSNYVEMMAPSPVLAAPSRFLPPAATTSPSNNNPSTFNGNGPPRGYAPPQGQMPPQQWNQYGGPPPQGYVPQQQQNYGPPGQQPPMMMPMQQFAPPQQQYAQDYSKLPPQQQQQQYQPQQQQQQHQPQQQQQQQGSKFGGMKGTLANSLVGGLGFGAGSAIAGDVIHSIF